MSSKADILARIRGQSLVPTALPRLDFPMVAYPDCEKHFIEVLTSVGGSAVVCPDPNQLETVLRGLPCLADAKRIIAIPNQPFATCDLEAIADPHELEDVDVAVLPGDFAVAENGAVWLSDRGIRQRAVYFLVQHLVLVVPRNQIVTHLHEAYARLRFDAAGYGLFLSGPSKTADIEQSLVIGAHGPRSQTVVLVGGV